MNKDVIYIDVEDDITAIIGKVKTSSEKVVALVPPKRVGVLQSAVNLRLLERIAKQNHKRLVLITNNHALTGLAAAAKLPVAKNLQSKPEIAEISALKVDDENDVIDGAALPVGELARTADEPAQVGDEISLAGMNLDGKEPATSKKAVAPTNGEAPRSPKAKKGYKVPNFNQFRKRFVLIIAGVILLIGFLIWAFFFAARATVEITANTSSLPLSQSVSLSADDSAESKEGVLQAVLKTEKVKESVEFAATGEENRGEKATGEVRFSSDSISVLSGGMTISAGTKLQSDSGATYTTDSTVSLSVLDNSGSTGITAVKPGESYNAASGSVSGAPRGISAQITDSTSGGTDKIVKVVTESDVQKAAVKLAEKENPEIRSKLEESFGKGVRVIDSSYQASKTEPVASPAVGEAASGNASLSSTYTYSMYGVSESEMSGFLDKISKEQIKDTKDQRIYDNGVKDANFTHFEVKGKTISVVITANAQVGPKIDEAALKEQIKGMRYGEVQAKLEAIQGINKVHTKFWPFWVSHVPDDTDRISIEFKLDESK